MDTVTQQNAADSEESASAAEELSVQADELNHVVIQLRALVSGAEFDKTAIDARGKTMSVSRVHQTVRHIGEHRDAKTAPWQTAGAAKTSHAATYPNGHGADGNKAGGKSAGAKSPTAKELIPFEDEEVLQRY